MLEKLKATKFNSIQELLNSLFASNLKFAIDKDTKEDLYILNENKVKNQSEHYQVDKDKNGKFYLKEIKV